MSEQQTEQPREVYRIWAKIPDALSVSVEDGALIIKMKPGEFSFQETWAWLEEIRTMLKHSRDPKVGAQ